MIFDLDGTLVDSAADVRDLINPLLRKLGRAEITRTDVMGCFGLGGVKFVQRALALASDPPVSAAQEEATTRAFLARYAVAPPVHATIYPGVLAVLGVGRAAGWRMGVCTNKPQAAADTLMRHLDLSQWFDAVTGGDVVERRKPDPAHLRDCIGQAGGTPERAIMVGDSETDAACAVAAGIPLILMAGGYHHTPLDGLGADRVLADWAALPEAIAALDPG